MTERRGGVYIWQYFSNRRALSLLTLQSKCMKEGALEHEGVEIVSSLQTESLQSLSKAAVYKHVELLLS